MLKKQNNLGDINTPIENMRQLQISNSDSRDEPLIDTVRHPGYQAITRKVGSAKLCVGCCIIGGLSNINKKFKLRMYDSEGNLVEIIEQSTRELMEEINSMTPRFG